MRGLGGGAHSLWSMAATRYRPALGTRVAGRFACTTFPGMSSSGLPTIYVYGPAASECTVPRHARRRPALLTMGTADFTESPMHAKAGHGTAGMPAPKFPTHDVHVIETCCKPPFTQPSLRTGRPDPNGPADRVKNRGRIMRVCRRSWRDRTLCWWRPPWCRRFGPC